MENSIVIPSSHLKYLVPGYKQRLEEIDNLIKELEEERSQITLIIESMDSGSIINTTTRINNVVNLEYSKAMSWFSKAKFVLKEEKKPLTTSQIVERIMAYEPDLVDRGLVVRNISSILGTKSKEDKEIERFKIEGKDQKFGLK